MRPFWDPSLFAPTGTKLGWMSSCKTQTFDSLRHPRSEEQVPPAAGYAANYRHIWHVCLVLLYKKPKQVGGFLSNYIARTIPPGANYGVSLLPHPVNWNSHSSILTWLLTAWGRDNATGGRTWPRSLPIKGRTKAPPIQSWFGLGWSYSSPSLSYLFLPCSLILVEFCWHFNF